ncbi:MAG: long-chain fatty acid--CoA ligase [Marmoricola sp.]
MAQFVHEIVGSAVQRFGDQVALRDAYGSVTYRQLWDRSQRLAGGLQHLGVVPGDGVVAIMHNRSEWSEVELAASMTGAVRSRLNSRDGAREWAAVLRDIAPKLIIAGPEFASTINGLIDTGEAPKATVLTLGDEGDYEDLLSAAHPLGEVTMTPDSPAVIFHTSGTTGVYKGVLYLQRNVMAMYRNILSTILADMDADSVILHVGPLSHQSGLLLIPGMFRGAQSLIHPGFDPKAVLDAIERDKVTHLLVAPAVINALVSLPDIKDRDLSSLRTIYYSGAPIAPSLLRVAIDVFGAIFMQGYGSTEGGAMYNSIMYPNEHVEALKSNPQRLASAGRAALYFDIKVADDDGNEVPLGEMGELWVRGDAVSVGYWNNPEATAGAYVDGWFRTGDFAIRDELDYLTIVDRKNDMIVSGGLNVYPREVEDVVAAHPAVNEVAVIGVPHDRWGEAVKACVSLHEGHTLTIEELQQFCKEQDLASYKKPLTLDIVPEVPKTAVGKLFRRALREPYWEGHERQVG